MKLKDTLNQQVIGEVIGNFNYSRVNQNVSTQRIIAKQKPSLHVVKNTFQDIDRILPCWIGHSIMKPLYLTENKKNKYELKNNN